ncbi:MAG TPA: shikimate dehydrogenase [Dongiaceae bacterium]|nr:shikimate dehydrogenase [Dongiaceae bacterium]
MTLTGKSRIAGIFGWPVDHSRSPRLHGYWLKQFGIDGAYIPFATHPAKLEQGMRALPALGFRGGNITLPHKERALALVDEATPLAKRIGAINTLIVREDGTILGDNTDGFGFIANLQHVQPGWRGASGAAIVLGAGGAARAIVVSLLDAGVPEVRLVNRTTRRAEEIAQAVGGSVKVLSWEARADALKDAALLVNSTTLGMAGQGPLDLDLRHLPTSALVYDIVYVPLITDLLKAAQQRGNPTVDGIGMLLHQGRPGFKAWFGQDPPVTPELRAFVLGG